MLSCPCSSSKSGAPGDPSSGKASGRPMESLIKDALKRLGGAKPFTAEDAAAAWIKAVGRKAGRHSRIVSLRRSRLVVNVDCSSWLYELTLKKKDVVRKLDGKFGAKKVKEIQFRVGEVGAHG